MNRKEAATLLMSKPSFLDRDSGIATTENEDEPATAATCIFSEDDDFCKRPEPTTFHDHEYSIHIADQTILLLKEYLQDLGWKKVLKHKSGTTVCMLQKQTKEEKFALFRGQAVINGFSPQSIFYVIGMRKLWDDKFEEGKLIKNLNGTSSLTYESYKPTNTSKAFDITLLEKIECTADGDIIFACTSVNIPEIPKMLDKSRQHVKLQGWLLKQISRHPVATQVTYITQENIRGWVPGFTKKSLARKPLIIAAVDGYLQRKADRLKSQGYNLNIQSLPITSTLASKSIKSELMSQKAYNHLQGRLSESVVLSNPPPRISSLNSTDTKFSLVSKSSSTIEEPSTEPKPNRLYPASPHRSLRKKSFEKLKEYIDNSVDDWSLIGEEGEVKMYTKSLENSALPIMRSDSEFSNAWSVEQICSVIQCFGARTAWDHTFESGQVIERYSQKEYLIHIKMKNLFPIQNRDFSILTSIESNINTGAVYIASTSVEDNLIPTGKCIRGVYVTYGWGLVPTHHSVRVTFVAHLKLGGSAPLPASVVRKLIYLVPSCLPKVKHYLEHTGCPPYVRRVAGKIIAEDYQNDHYSMTYIAKHTPSRRSHSSWCTDLRIHPSAFPQGFRVTADPKNGIRVIAKQDGLRIFTESATLEGKKICLKVAAREASKQFISNENELIEIKEKKTAAREANIDKVKKLGSYQNKLIATKDMNETVVIVTEDLSFSIWQLCFIALVMVFCYYMGKISTQCQSC